MISIAGSIDRDPETENQNCKKPENPIAARVFEDHSLLTASRTVHTMSGAGARLPAHATLGYAIDRELLLGGQRVNRVNINRTEPSCFKPSQADFRKYFNRMDLETTPIVYVGQEGKSAQVRAFHRTGGVTTRAR